MSLELDIMREGPLLLNEKRWEHSLRTADFAEILARQYSVSVELVRLAALSHDFARQQPEQVVLDWAGRDQVILSDFCLNHPVLLHGFASAWYLRTKYSIDNPSVLNAVRYHTTGHPALDKVGLVVFAADYMEPGRTHISDSERTELQSLSLDGLVLSILKSMESYLLSINAEPSPDSRELYRILKKRYNGAP